MPKRNNRRRRNEVLQVVDRSTPDGASFVSIPSLRALTYQRVYKFDLIARNVKRYSMTVGVSPILDYLNFAINDISNIGEYTALFDQYRIVQVVAMFIPRATQTYIGNSSGDVPFVQTAIDYNDNSATGTAPSEYQSCVTTQMTTAFVRRLTPRYAVPVYNGVTSAYVQGPKDGWIDATYNNVPHYQLVVSIGATSLDAQFVYEVDVLYSLEFKTVR